MNDEQLTELEQEVVRRYCAGLSAGGVGARLGLAVDKVYRILRMAGISPRRPDAASKVLRDRDIIRRYVQWGWSCKELAIWFRLSEATVWKILRFARVSGFRPGSTLERRNREVADLYLKEHRSLSEVGARFGISPQRVSRILERAGIRRRGPGARSRQRSRLTSQDQEHRNREAVRLYVDMGLSLREVGGRLGLSQERVRQILRATGVGGRFPGLPTP